MSRPLPVVATFVVDEERAGFGAPLEAPPPRSLDAAERAALAIFGLGCLSLVVQLAGASIAGTWPGLLSGLPLAALGLGLYFWASFRATPPGIRHDGVARRGISSRGVTAWVLGVVLTGFYTVLYWFPSHLERATALVDPLAVALSGRPADGWFLYGLLYTLAVSVFGVRAAMKYRHNRYQLARTASVVFFQLGFAFLLPQVLKGLRQPELYLTYFWPLKYDALFPSSVKALWDTPGGLGMFMVVWGAVATFVATPVLTYFHGKRWYCSWVCGCGGLAETAGDAFRQLSNKSDRAWTIERWTIHGVLVLIVVTTALLWLAPGELSNTLARSYGFWIGALFSGVIGVGFYPLLGSRVWCRFGCPMAAILGLLQRTVSRFRITTNGGQCMSCGNCSTFCEMGIDVRAYAQRGEDIVRASCVGCGVCAAVCPRGVLRLESGPAKTPGLGAGGR